jgi:hypothetical protein
MTEFNGNDPMSDELLEQQTFEENKDYIFEIHSIGERVQTAKSFYRTFVFRTFVDGNVAEVTQNLFPFQMIPLAHLLGIAPQDKSTKVDWNQVLVENKCIVAKVKFKKYSYTKDGQTKEGTGKEIYDIRATDAKTSGDGVAGEEEIPF